MIKKFCFGCLIISFAFACNNNKNPNEENTHKLDTLTQDNNITKADSNLKYKIDTSKQVTTGLLPKRDTLLKIDFNNSNTASVEGYLSGIGKHVSVLVPVSKGDSLIAELIPDVDTANIRFTQIYIPVGKSGKYDGPFGRTLRYPIKTKGDYRLIIGENLMAEGDWKGNFKCNVSIK